MAAKADGIARERFQKGGFHGLALELCLGLDLLPSTLHQGIVILETGGQFAVWEKDVDVEIQPEACPGLPAEGLLNFKDKRQRTQRPDNQQVDDEELTSVVSKALDMLRHSHATCQLLQSPFAEDAVIYLNDILDKVK